MSSSGNKRLLSSKPGNLKKARSVGARASEAAAAHRRRGARPQRRGKSLLENFREHNAVPWGTKHG